MLKIIKEIIIMLLVCLLAMLVFSVLLYKYVPSKKDICPVVTYVASEEVQDLLEDDVEKRADKEKKDAVLVLTSRDLTNYERTYDYIPGKANPFAEYKQTIEGEAEQPEGGENQQSTTQEETNTVEENKNNEYYNASNSKTK